MEITLEKIIELVTREVIKELSQKGLIDQNSFPSEKTIEQKSRSVEIDMSEYKTPVLTANNLDFLHNNVKEIVIPKNTVITPGAADIIKRKTLTTIYKN